MAKKTRAVAARKSGPNLGLGERTRATVIGVLETVLADEVVLYIKTRNYHWNVVGPDFSEMHKFFEEQYEALDEVFDDVAERIRALGGRAPGSMAEFLKRARLPEHVGVIAHAQQLAHSLLTDHEALIRHLRADIAAVDAAGDVGTEDFLTGLMTEHEKMAWMLRSYGQ
jgi:starvation-inducible DNA-binding protein